MVDSPDFVPKLSNVKRGQRLDGGPTDTLQYKKMLDGVVVSPIFTHFVCYENMEKSLKNDLPGGQHFIVESLFTTWLNVEI